MQSPSRGSMSASAIWRKLRDAAPTSDFADISVGLAQSTDFPENHSLLGQ